MMKKLIKVGNSQALTISKDILHEVGNVDIVKVHFESSKKRMIVDFNQEDVVDTIVNPEVYKVAKNLLKKYRAAFTELANR